MFFMENIVFSIVPVRETGVVTRGLRDGLGWFNDLIDFWCSSLALLSKELGLVCRGEVHIMRVNNLAFFLEIEGTLVVLHIGLRQLAVVVLLVVRVEALRVRVPDKPIDAARHSCALIAGR